MRIFLFALLPLFPCQLSAAERIDLSVEQVRAMQHAGDALVIDIRSEQEWQTTGTIPLSHKLEFFSSDGHYDADIWLPELGKLKSSPDQPVILVRRSANRSGMVSNFLTQRVGMKNVYHLSGGIKSWIPSRHQRENNCSNSLACK